MFQIFITVLVICSMLFAKYSMEQKQSEAVAVMAYGKKNACSTNITFSDLAKKIDTFVGGDKSL